jgi:hypothetical protein
MTLLTELMHRWRTALSHDFTATTLKAAIVIWAIFVCIMVIFFVDNKWLLAGILLYEVLP